MELLSKDEWSYGLVRMSRSEYEQVLNNWKDHLHSQTFNTFITSVLVIFL